MEKKELKILIGLHRAVNHIDRQSIYIFKKHDLTMGQFAVLEVLYHKGDLTVGQVQEMILSTSGTIPVIVKNLEKREYLTRHADGQDKRRCILHITSKGAVLMKQVYPQNEAKIIEMLDVLNDEEKNDLIILLKKIGGYNNESND